MGIFKLFTEQKLMSFDFDNLFSTVKKYGKIGSVDSEKNFLATECDDIRNIYFGNLHFFYLKNDKDRILRAFIKNPEDEWAFSDNNSGKANNEEFQVYIKFDVDVLGEERCFCEKYKSGNWDLYIIKAISALKRFVEEMTEYSKFQKVYKN